MSILLKRLLGKVISTFSENPWEYARGRGYLTLDYMDSLDSVIIFDFVMFLLKLET
jgi:hypothetical protein